LSLTVLQKYLHHQVQMVNLFAWCNYVQCCW